MSESLSRRLFLSGAATGLLGAALDQAVPPPAPLIEFAPSVLLFSRLQLRVIAPTLDRIRTVGFSVVGKGAADYRRVPTPPLAERLAGFRHWIGRDASGAWWKLDEAVPESDMFGTLGDVAGYNWLTHSWTGGTSAVVPIQKMIDFCRYFGGSGKCRISPGFHLVDREIFSTYGEPGRFGRLEIAGAGSNSRGSIHSGGTCLVCASASEPVISTQGARGVHISGISFLGPLTPHIQRNLLGTAAPAAGYRPGEARDHSDVANWFDPAILARNANVNHRYAPLAAIAIDPRSGPRPAVHYPDVPYPAFLGPLPQYAKALSSEVYVRDCYFSGFAAPMICHPCDENAQGDMIGLRDCVIECCPYGISVGNTQCRNVEFSDIRIAFFHTIMTNRVHGPRQGAMHGSYDNISAYGGGINFIDITPPIGGPITLSNCYAEVLWRIGNWGANAGGYANPLTFNGCLFTFHHYEGEPASGNPATFLSKAARAHVTFAGCAFQSFGEIMVFDGAAENFSFTGGCRIGDGAVGGSTRAHEYVAANFLANVCFTVSTSSANRPAEFSTVAARIDVDTGTAETSGGTRNDDCVTDRAHNGCAWARHAVPSRSRNVRLPMPPLWKFAAKGSGSGRFHGVSLSGRTLTATAPDHMTGSDAARKHFGILPGSIIFDDAGSYVFRIEAVNAGVITARLLNGYRQTSSGAIDIGDGAARGTPLTPFSRGSGNFYVGNAAVYSPAFYTLGDLDGTTRIGNVGRADRHGAYLTGEFKAGDLLFGDPEADDSLALSQLNAIAGVNDGNPGELTTTAAATATRSRYNIGFLIRGDIPNRT